MIADSAPDSVVHIERAVEDLRHVTHVPPHMKSPPPQNRRSHHQFELTDWDGVAPGLISQLDRWCERYGYDTVTHRINQLKFPS